MTKLSKNGFLLLMKYQHVANVFMKFYSCATCVKGIGRDWTIHQYWRNMEQKNHSPENFIFANSKEPSSHSFWATGLMLVPKEPEFCGLQSYWEFFFQISNSGKSYAVWIFSFLGKNASLWKKLDNSKTKMKFEKKTFCSFVEDEIPLRLIYVSTV